MSHHFDYSADERLDISDAYCFAGPSGRLRPAHGVRGTNACPDNASTPADPAGYYELKVDTNEDLIEDITWRFTFPVDSGLRAARRGGRAPRPGSQRPQRARPDHHAPQRAGGRGARGGAGHQDLRRPAHRLVLQLPAVPHHVGEGPEPGLLPGPGRAGSPTTDYFLNQVVHSILIEAPAEVTGLRRLNYWATTAVYDQGHGWVQLQQGRHGPNGTTLWTFTTGSAGLNINATVPSQEPRAGRPCSTPETDSATGVWGQIRDQTAVVVGLGGTYNQGVHGRPTALAYGAYVADVFLPMVIPFTPGTNALWDPWQGSHNGKGR